MTEPAARPRRVRWRRRLRRAALAALVVWTLLWCAETVLDRGWPYPRERMAQPPGSVVVTAADGAALRVTSGAGWGRQLWVPLDRVSPWFVEALVLAEDERFFGHAGVDFVAAGRAAVQNVSAGRIVSGASTLTMQLARLVEPHERSMPGKLFEMFRARQIERLWSKHEILEQYVNRVPMGGVLHGVEAAARYWFGCSAAELGPAQAAALVAMIPSPSSRSPRHSSQRLVALRNAILDLLLAARRIERDEYTRACTQSLGMRAHPWPFGAPHAVDRALRLRRPAAGGELRTSIDADLQERLEWVVQRVDDGLADGVAVVVLERAGGPLRAMVGSVDWHQSQLNAATCRRPVGSTLKPFLYALAIDAGCLAVDGRVEDRPVDYSGWRPANFQRDLRGSIAAKDALASSRNLPAVRLLEKVGTARFAELLHRLGLPADARGLHLDAALGTLSASPLEVARAWQRFTTRPEEVGLRATSVAPVVAALQQRPLGGGAERSVAWKSGTSSGRRDAWCVGVTAEHVVVVWRGNLEGGGRAGLVGFEAAGGLLADVVAEL